MSRIYVVFGSNDDGETLVPVGRYEATDHDAAKKLARDSGHEAYGSCPEGNWSFGKLAVKEIIDFEPIELFPAGEQLTVEDAVDAAVAEARVALGTRESDLGIPDDEIKPGDEDE